MAPEELDARLNSSEHERLKKLVRELPSEPMSLAWRSGLNEKLAVEAGRVRRRRRAVWIWRPALGLGLAGALALIVLVGHPSSSVAPKENAGNVEAALVKAHGEAVADEDVAGVGLNSFEVEQDSELGADSTDGRPDKG